MGLNLIYGEKLFWADALALGDPLILIGHPI